MKRRKIVALMLTSVMALSACTVVPVEDTSETEETSAEVTDFGSIRAQDDFYGYVNAQSLYEADIEDNNGSAGAFVDIQNIVDDQVDGIIDEIVNGDRSTYTPGSNEQLIYDFYYQVLDASTGGTCMSDEDISYLNDLAQQILDTTSIEEYLELCGTLYTDWKVNPIFGGNVETDLNNSSQGSIQIRPFTSPSGDALSDIILGGYSAQNAATSFRTVLIDFGMDYEEAQERSMTDASFIMSIANGSDLDLIELISEDWGESMNHAIYRSNEEINELCPNVGIEGIMTTLNIDTTLVNGVYLWDEGQLSTIDSLLTDENLPVWQDIALLSLIGSLTDYLPEEYGGQPVLYSNDLYARDIVNNILITEMGEEYAERYLDEQTVADVTLIAQDLTDEYIEIIGDCEWLSDEGKEAIIAKLNSMEYFIGADEPHEIDPDDALLIGDTVFETMRNLNVRDYEDNIDKLINGVERNGFEGMPPHIVNACYMPDINAIDITLAIMNAPFYSADQTYWQNLGGIGSVVGHEISHAFDNHGMLFDMYGNFNPTWMPEGDREAFDEMASRVADYYSGYTILDIHSVDGELTLGENLADMSGVECILSIADNNDQRQEILENYARVWAAVTPKDNALYYLYEDVHSPDLIRVNAVVPIFDCFYEIYDVQEGDGMYVAPEDRVRRW